MGLMVLYPQFGRKRASPVHDIAPLEFEHEVVSRDSSVIQNMKLSRELPRLVLQFEVSKHNH